MKEKVKEIMNLNGYNLADDVTLMEMVLIMNRHKIITDMLEELEIVLPVSCKKHYFL